MFCVSGVRNGWMLPVVQPRMASACHDNFRRGAAETERTRNSHNPCQQQCVRRVMETEIHRTVQQHGSQGSAARGSNHPFFASAPAEELDGLEENRCCRNHRDGKTYGSEFNQVLQVVVMRVRVTHE